jgi:hypothetical protein
VPTARRGDAFPRRSSPTWPFRSGAAWTPGPSGTGCGGTASIPVRRHDGHHAGHLCDRFDTQVQNSRQTRPAHSPLASTAN